MGLLRAGLQIGPFSFAISTDSAPVFDDLRRGYGRALSEHARPFVDFDIAVRCRSIVRRYLRPQIDFFYNEHRPFKPLPRDQGYAMLEWGMNWCIANHAHQYLILHAGVLEKGGRALLLPAAQGAGKSTLTAMLSCSGWRLFSDELALIDPLTRELQPVPRPINLKNDAIDILRDFAPGASFSRTAHDTAKGTVALMAPAADSLERMTATAPAGAVVFPRYTPGAGVDLEPVSPLAAFEEVLAHSFNYHVLGELGFRCLAGLFRTVPAYRLTYSDFPRAEAALGALLEDAG